MSRRHRAATGRAAAVRRGPKVGDPRPPPTTLLTRDRVPARDVVATPGQSLQPAVADRDPPQLVGAVDRRAEEEPAPAPRCDELGRLAAGHVAGHRGTRHEIVPGGQVPPALRGRIGPVRGEQPDVVATPRPARHPMSEGGDRPSVGQPRRRREHRSRPARDRRHDPGLDVDDVDVLAARAEVRVASPVRAERDPSGRRATRPARGPRPGRP